MRKRIHAFWLIPLLLVGFTAICPADQPLPKEKQTQLNLYITAREAYLKWNGDPEKINILDVRTPAEYVFVGHAPMAVNIPLRFFAGDLNPLTLKPSMPMNPGFVDQVKEKFSPGDTILVMCRSGARSAAAVNLLAKAGFKQAYNIVDGFEGDKLDLPESYLNGKRIINGWINSGAPWTYKLERDRVYKP